MEEGVAGEALAGTLLDGIPGVEGGGRFQSRRYEGGRLVSARLAGDAARLTLPDGSTVITAGMPLGELMAAQRASGAPNVIAASGEAPSSPVARAIMPLATSLLAIGPVRAFARRRLATVKVKTRSRPREHSWATRSSGGRTARGARAGCASARRRHGPARCRLKWFTVYWPGRDSRVRTPRQPSSAPPSPRRAAANTARRRSDTPVPSQGSPAASCVVRRTPSS